MRSLLLASLVVTSACGDGDGPSRLFPSGPDAPLAPLPDARDAPEGPAICGASGTGRRITGTLVELTSTASAFAAIPGAALTQRGGEATGTTAADGSYELCAHADETYQLDVDAPGDHLDAIAVIHDRAFNGVAQQLSLRTASASELSAFYAARGLQLDLTRGQVLVLMVGLTWSSVELADATHGPAHAAEDYATPGTLAWRAGTAGQYVLFPNVVAAEPAATVRTAATMTAAPIEPGKLTIVVVADFFCFAAPCV